MMDEPKFVASLEVEATPEELENLEKSSPMVDEEERNKFRAALKMQEPDLPKGRIARLKSRQVNKFVTPLWQVEDMFIVNQKGKNNTESTVKYYKKVFRHLYRFLAYLVAESPDEYAKLLNISKDKLIKTELDDVKFGALLPLVVLETDDFEAEYAFA